MISASAAGDGVPSEKSEAELLEEASSLVLPSNMSCLRGRRAWLTGPPKPNWKRGEVFGALQRGVSGVRGISTPERGFLRVRGRGTHGTRVADTAAACLDRAHGPFVLVCCVALVVLRSAAQVGCGRGLFRGHG